MIKLVFITIFKVVIARNFMKIKFVKKILYFLFDRIVKMYFSHWVNNLFNTFDVMKFISVFVHYFGCSSYERSPSVSQVVRNLTYTYLNFDTCHCQNTSS